MDGVRLSGSALSAVCHRRLFQRPCLSTTVIVPLDFPPICCRPNEITSLHTPMSCSISLASLCTQTGLARAATCPRLPTPLEVIAWSLICNRYRLEQVATGFYGAL